MSEFITSTGRTIRLLRLSISGTYEGQLEGSPEHLSTLILKNNLPAWVAQFAAKNEPLLVLPTDSFPLPDFIWTAKLTSRRGVKNTDPDFYSELTLRWFADGLNSKRASMT